MTTEFDSTVYARWFETDLGYRVWADERRALDRLLTPVAGTRVVDVGAGDGRLALELSRAGATVVAVDRSPSMLRAGRERTNLAEPGVSWVRADVTALPFASATFDVAVAVTVLCFAREPLVVVRELTRVTRPGGRVVLGELGRWSLWAVQRRLRAWRHGGIWASAQSWTRRELRSLLKQVGVRPARTSAAVFYPRRPAVLRLMPRIDAWLGKWTSVGAAFVAVMGRKVNMRASRTADASRRRMQQVRHA